MTRISFGDMRPGTRRAPVVLLVLAFVVTAACGFFRKEYEYEEELTLSIDGSATIRVNASVAALVALRGMNLDPASSARPDREQLRALFTSQGVEVSTPRFSQRHGRRFVHVRVDVPDVRQLGRLGPFSWSTYRIDRSSDTLVFRQVVGKSSGRPIDESRWNGTELVAFRLHAPSRILFENATTDVQRGNILAWEQSLAERLAGAPIELHVEMAPESILHTTLLLFASTIVAAGATFALAIWWVRKKGREVESQIPTPKSQTSTPRT
jgi:hypothetical protein